MKLKNVLIRLKKTIDLSKTLENHQFSYEKFVNEYDVETNCGTVCCIAGHYPNWGIEGFKYEKRVFGDYYLDTNEILRYSYTEDALSYYHGLSLSLIIVLFCGKNCDGTFTDCFDKYITLHDYKLSDVIHRFETVYELLKNKTISPDWEFPKNI